MTARTYSVVRAMEPTTPVEAAARVVYLNRTCYGGLYRTNRQGLFNTPDGGGSRTPALLWRNRVLARCSKLLSKGVGISEGDFDRSSTAQMRVMLFFWP